MTEPRWLDREAVARYISVRVDEIPRLLKTGRLPKPSYHLGPRSPRWDRGAVDQAFAGQPVAAVASPPAMSEMVARRVEEITKRQTGRQGRSQTAG